MPVSPRELKSAKNIRKLPTLERENALWLRGIDIVAGLDEVGRGPLAGPVVASAVIFHPRQDPIEGLNDSKQLSNKRREELFMEIQSKVLGWTVCGASVREIDRMNIRRATALAMRRALSRLPRRPDHVLVDGNEFPEIGRDHEPIIKGDSISQSIAAASVLAKVIRDRLMERLGSRYPEYGWELNKGYATAEHLAALKKGDPSPHHRKSFAPMNQFDLFGG